MDNERKAKPVRLTPASYKHTSKNRQVENTNMQDQWLLVQEFHHDEPQIFYARKT